MKKIGCLHAHHSNIDYINQALAPYNVELLHFVDPGLVERFRSDPLFLPEQAHMKIQEQLYWIASCQVDAILITCTNYIAMLRDEDEQAIPIPIVKIDDPFFSYVCSKSTPQLILFTNPATVPGTMERLRTYAAQCGASIHAEAIIIENTFELIMKGKKEQYMQELVHFLRDVHEQHPNKEISVAQLSMVEAAEQVEKELNIFIGNPLKLLTTYLEEKTKLG